MSLPNMMKVFQDVLGRLDEAQIPYMVVGSVCSIIYGEPRMTKDIDIVIDIPVQDAIKFEFNFPFEGFYLPPPEVLKDEIVRRGQFNLGHHETGLKIDVVVRKQSPHAREEFKRRRKIAFWEGFHAFVASPEDVIIKKLDFFREGRSEKHLGDIRGILAHSEVDKDYVSYWVNELGLKKYWEKI